MPEVDDGRCGFNGSATAAATAAAAAAAAAAAPVESLCC